MSDSPGLVDIAIGLVNSVINLPDGQVNFFEEFKLQKNCEINLLIKTFLRLVEMTSGLVNVSFSLPEWQAVKMTFFAPWVLPLSHNNNLTLFECFCQIQQVLAAVQVREVLDQGEVLLLWKTKSCLKAQASRKMSAHWVSLQWLDLIL